jgi:hypothetical protein
LKLLVKCDEPLSNFACTFNLRRYVTALQGLAISLGQASLKMNSMSFFQLTKQMQLPLVATIEFVMLGRRLTTVKVLLLVVMTAGVCLSNAADVQFSFVVGRRRLTLVETSVETSVEREMSS